MEVKFSSVDERAGHYCLQYLDAEGWKEKGESLLEWYKAMIYGFFGFRTSDAEWYLYETFEERFFNDVESELYLHTDNTREVNDRVEVVYEWYDAAKCAISDGAAE